MLWIWIIVCLKSFLALNLQNASKENQDAPKENQEMEEEKDKWSIYQHYAELHVLVGLNCDFNLS